MAEEFEKRVPVFDYMQGDFLRDPIGRIVTVTEGEAVAQVAIKALQTSRSKYLIYMDNEDPDMDDKYGSEVAKIAITQGLPENVRISEMTRAITEALIYDPWITGVSDIVIERVGSDEAIATMSIQTIFDVDVELEGVELNG